MRGQRRPQSIRKRQRGSGPLRPRVAGRDSPGNSRRLRSAPRSSPPGRGIRPGREMPRASARCRDARPPTGPGRPVPRAVRARARDALRPTPGTGRQRRTVRRPSTGRGPPLERTADSPATRDRAARMHIRDTPSSSRTIHPSRSRTGTASASQTAGPVTTSAGSAATSVVPRKLAITEYGRSARRARTDAGPTDPATAIAVAPPGLPDPRRARRPHATACEMDGTGRGYRFPAACPARPATTARTPQFVVKLDMTPGGAPSGHPPRSNRHPHDPTGVTRCPPG